ncbi:hypothetical protein LUZ60_001591 [Juncus effusus]|nr:hypothetical protein LUZ60_001591 [Juncus effusus]
MYTSVFLQPTVGAVSGFATLKTKTDQRSSIMLKSKPRTTCSPLRIYCMKTWSPINNEKFETLSYLPPLSEDSIAKEVDYILSKGWIPCLEFDEVGHVYRKNSTIPGYYDGRYWTLWKLPMFGCTDSAQVLRELQECKETYPNAYIRLLSFDNIRQCQSMSFIIQKPQVNE